MGHHRAAPASRGVARGRRRGGGAAGAADRARTRTGDAHARSSGQHQRLVLGTDLRPGLRLRADVVQGLRCSGARRHAARQHRRTRPRRAVRDREGRPHRRPDPLQARCGDRPALAGAGRHPGGVAAGSRRPGGQCRGPAGAGAGGAAPGRALPGAGAVQEHRGAVRRRRDFAQHRHRQLRQRRRRRRQRPRRLDRAVQRRRHPQDAGVRVGAAGLCRHAQAGPDRDADAAAISRADLPRRVRDHSERVQPDLAHRGDRAHRRQPGPLDLARHLHRRALRHARGSRRADRAGAGAAVPRPGDAGGTGPRRRHRAPPGRQARPQPGAERAGARRADAG